MELPAEIKQKLHYDELNKLLKENLEKQILIIQMTTVPDEYARDFPKHPNKEYIIEPVLIATKFRFYLGIINGEKVEYKKDKDFDKIIIPTKKHVHRYHADFISPDYLKWGLLSGPIMISTRGIIQANTINMNKNAEYIQSHMHENEINFLFGKNVEDYFKGDNSYKNALELLKLKP